jgi:hypothetical protein
MKKFALATLLAFAAFSASAVEVKLEAQNSVGQNGTADQTVYEFGLKEKINNNFAGDIVIKNYRTDGTDALATRYEAGVTGNATLYGPVSGYTRVAVGEKYKSGSSGFSYYSVEPGISVPVAIVPGMAASLGYRYQDAFGSGHSDETRTWRSKVSYDINKTSTVYLGYDSQRGDSDANITKVGYVHRF